MGDKAKTDDNTLQPPIFVINDFNSTTKLAEKSFDNDDTEAYNPFDHRVVEKPNSTFGSLAHLLKSSLGTGILAMPAAIKNAGLLFGAVGTLVVGFLCTHCVHILVKTSHDICKKTRVPVLGFSETAERVFQYGPEKLRPWSRFVKEFVDYALMATYFGAACVYIVFIAESFKEVINKQLEIKMDVRLYILIIMIPILLIGQIRQLKYLIPFSAIANVFIIVTFSITLYYIFENPKELEFSKRPLVAPVTQWPLFFSTVIFAMEGIGVVMPVENSMKRPQDFLGCPGVLNTAMISVISLYTIIGFFGYAKYDDAKGSITLNLPDEPLGQTAKLLMALAVLFTFGLQFFVPMDILWRKVQDRIPVKQHNLSQILIRTGIMLWCAVVAAVVPELEPFIGLVGAVFFSSLGILVPSIVEAVFLYPDNYGPMKWKLVKDILLAIFAILALCTGAFVSIKQIIESYGKKETD